MRLNQTLRLKLILMLFDSVYSTHPSNTTTKYTVYLPILLVERLLKWSCVLFSYFILWLAKSGSKMSCILLFETEHLLKFFFQKSCFFVPSFGHQDLNSYYGGTTTEKSQNIRLWTSFFRYENLKIMPLIASEIFK